MPVPTFNAVRPSSPVANVATVSATNLPPINTADTISAGHMWSDISERFTSIPIEMKNNAAKKSFTGETSLTSLSDCFVSPSTTPIKNAPAAGDTSSSCAISASPKHMARVASSMISSDLYLEMNRTTPGATRAPIPSAANPNRTSFNTRDPTPTASTVPVDATPESTVSNMTAATSSITRMPTIIRPRTWCSCSAIPQHLVEDRSAGYRKRRPQEYRLRSRPPQQRPDFVPQGHHQ